MNLGFCGVVGRMGAVLVCMLLGVLGVGLGVG